MTRRTLVLLSLLVGCALPLFVACEASLGSPVDVSPPPRGVTTDELSAAPADRVSCDAVVAANGAGTSCTYSSPCSLERGQALARSLAPYLADDFNVCLREGIYEMTAPLVLDGALDSGQNGHSIVYRNYPGETPRLNGGRRITGWSLYDAAQNLYRAPVGVGGPSIRQLYVNAIRSTRARDPGPLPSGFTQIADGFRAPPSYPVSGLRNPSDIEIVSLRAWKSFRCGVASITGQDIHLDQPCYSFTQFITIPNDINMIEPTWFENVYERLGTPGEFYHDRVEGFVYYVPRANQNLLDPNTWVIAPRLEALLIGQGTADVPLHHVAVRGVLFANTTWEQLDSPVGYADLFNGTYIVGGTPTAPALASQPGAIRLAHAHDVVFERNIVARIGATALTLGEGSKRVRVVGNRFNDVSGLAIRVVGDPNASDPRYLVEDDVVSNNFIAETGAEYLDSAAVSLAARHARVEHNEIANGSYSGIVISGWGAYTGNVIRQNLIRNVMRRMLDGGGIYIAAPQPGTVFEDNYIHDVVHVYAGLYFDFYTSNIEARRNVVSSVPYWYMSQIVVPPYARDLIIEDNHSNTADAFCCFVDPATGIERCCTDPDLNNVIQNNEIFPPTLPSLEAHAIMDAAGITPAYLDIRPTTAIVQAEDYMHGGEGVGYLDLTDANEGGSYRTDQVDIYPWSAVSNAHTVGYTQTGEWTRYAIDVRRAGNHAFSFRVATEQPGNSITLEVDGTTVGSVALPNTGSFGTYAWVQLPSQVTLSSGTHFVRVLHTGGFAFDELSYVAL